MTDSSRHIAISQWNKLEHILATAADGATCSDDDKTKVRLDSRSLDLASLVAVSRLAMTIDAAPDHITDIHHRYGVHAYLDEVSLQRLWKSTKTLEDSLAGGKIIYGKRIFDLRTSLY